MSKLATPPFASIELYLAPQAVIHRAEVSYPANYATQPNTAGCGIAAPTSRVFHIPPGMCTVSDETHRPAQRVNLFMSTGHTPLFLNHMSHNVNDTVSSLLTGHKLSTLIIQVCAMARTPLLFL
jgi:hypothetical protein